MGASISDIAKKVGVSISTVSYALNDGPRPVGSEMKRRILEVARELDYRPNRIARSMVTGKSNVVGVVNCDIRYDMLSRPFLQQSLNGIANVAQEFDKDVLLYTHSARATAEDVLGLLVDGRAEGIIFLAPENENDVIDLIDRRRLPYVVVAGTVRTRTTHVLADNRSGIEAAVQHLVGLGHTKIGHIAGRETQMDGVERLSTFREALSKRGLELRDEWVAYGDFDPEAGLAAASQVLKNPRRPTALVCGNDEMAASALRCAQEIGLRVPQDLSLIGFDDNVVARLCNPQLTTVNQPADDMGAAAMRALALRLAGEETQEVIRFPTQLIVRGSTGPI